LSTGAETNKKSRSVRVHGNVIHLALLDALTVTGRWGCIDWGYRYTTAPL